MRNHLLLRKNSSLYATHQKARFVSFHSGSDARYHGLVSTPLTPYLACVLERSEGGATRAELAQSIQSTDPEIEPDDAESYIDELIDEELLVPDMGPVLTEANPIASVVAQLKSHPEATKAASGFEAAATALANLDRDGRAVPPQRYREIFESLSPTTSRLVASSIFQVRLLPGASTSSLPPRLLEELLGARRS